LCHCLSCQRRTGSLFSIAASYERAEVIVTQGIRSTFTRGSATGLTVTFHFCPRCGTSVYWEPARTAHLIGVAVGAFAEPNFPPPEQAVWTSERHCWLEMPADMRRFAENPPLKGK